MSAARSSLTRSRSPISRDHDRRARPAGLIVALALLLAAGAAPACEPSSTPPDAPLALVLSGGGAKGAWEAGVAARLIEGGVPVRLVAGSSAGALNAAMVADGRLDRLQALWRTLTREQVYALRPSIVLSGLLPGWLTLLTLNSARALFDPGPLRDLLATALDLDRVRASPVALLVLTTDLKTRTPRVFDNRTLTIDALMAASAVPGAFPPVDVDGDLLVDGGLIGRAPVLEALAAAPDVRRALVVMSYAPGEGGRAPTSMRRALEEAFETAMIHQIDRDAELARYRHPAVDVQRLVPSAPLDLRPLDFETAGMARALDRGRADAETCLARWSADRP